MEKKTAMVLTFFAAKVSEGITKMTKSNENRM